MKEQKFRKLDVWKKAMNLVEEIYRMTEIFPQKELCGLTTQLRRAANSIALNIAEGSGADSDVEFKRFLTIALRSNYELMCGLEIATRLEYCSESQRDNLLTQCDELAAMLSSFCKRLRLSPLTAES